MSRDTVDRCLGTSLHLRGSWGWSGWDSAGLEVPGRVEGELAQELAGVAVDDPDVQVVDEQGDRGAGVAPADADDVPEFPLQNGPFRVPRPSVTKSAVKHPG